MYPRQYTSSLAVGQYIPFDDSRVASELTLESVDPRIARAYRRIQIFRNAGV